MRSRWSAVALLVMLSGCVPDEVGPTGQQEESGAQHASGERLAAMVAGAMEAPEFRGEMLRILRNSPYAEHAVPVGELIGGPDGGLFLGALARAGGIDREAVRALVASLPPLDLYVPRRADREQWEGALSLIVAVRVDAELPRVGFTPAGGTMAIDLTGSEVTPPLFLLQFAEHKAYRLEPAAPRASGAIQPAAESDQAMAFVGHDPSGREVLAQVRDLPTDIQGAKYCPPDIPGCPPENPGGGGGDPDPTPGDPIGSGTTKLVKLITDGECDNTFCGEGNEFEFRAYATGHTSILRIEGVPSSATLNYTNKIVASFSPIPLNSIAVHVWETDVWSDDHFVYLNGAAVSNPDLHTDPTSTSGRQWSLWRSPNIDPYTYSPKVYATFTWTN